MPANGEPLESSQRILDAFRRVVRSLRVASRATEKSLGLTGPQLFVLHKLARVEALSLGELAIQTMTDQSTVSVVVSRLVQKGLVDRGRDSEDGRKLVLSLSPRGRAALDDAPTTTQDRLVQALGRMPAAKRLQLAQLLETVVAEAGLTGEEPAMFFEDER